MWKRNRPSELPTPTPLVPPPRTPRRDEPRDLDVRFRPRPPYDGDLMQGDEGIDDPPGRA